MLCLNLFLNTLAINGASDSTLYSFSTIEANVTILNNSSVVFFESNAGGISNTVFAPLMPSCAILYAALA